MNRFSSNLAHLIFFFPLTLLLACGAIEPVPPPTQTTVEETRSDSPVDSDADQIPDDVEEVIDSDPHDRRSPNNDEKEDYGLLDAPLSGAFWDCVIERLTDYGYLGAALPFGDQIAFKQMTTACLD